MPDKIRTPESFWTAIESLSLSRAALLRAAKLPVSSAAPDARMSTAQLFSLWDALQELGGPDVGLALTRTMHSSTLPPSFLVAYHAKTVGEALQRVARFKTLTAPEEILLRTAGNRCTITTAWADANRQEPSALTDASFSFLVNMVRAGSGKPIRPLALTLCRNPSEALQSWFDCPITWNARQACLVFDRADLDIPFLSYNRELLEMLDRALDADLNRAAQNVTLADQVRWHLRRALTAGRPELCTIARDMAISERSLQRRLQSEGHSFKSLLSETRRQLAREYLADPELEISETAYLLGYEDQGSFFRAFRKWENQTPAEWRSAQGG